MLDVPSYHAIAAMVITVAMFVAFARGRYSVEIVSLITIAVIAVGLYFAPLPDTKPTDGLALAFGGFGHYALITICALMIMGRGLVVTGALEPAARFLEGVFKLNLQMGLLVSLLIAFFLSMAVNDTPVLVLLLPIFVALAAKGAMPASKTLIPLNAAVLIGGMATTIGTSTASPSPFASSVTLSENVRSEPPVSEKTKNTMTFSTRYSRSGGTCRMRRPAAQSRVSCPGRRTSRRRVRQTRASASRTSTSSSESSAKSARGRSC